MSCALLASCLMGSVSIETVDLGPRLDPPYSVELAEFSLPTGAGNGQAPAADSNGMTVVTNDARAGEATASGTFPDLATAAKSGRPYDSGVFWKQAGSAPWRLGGAAAAITATGFANWNWGSSRFKFKREGWFGKNTANGGMDKLGHAYSTYVLTEFLTDGIRAGPGTDRSRSYTAAILAMGLMTYIEVFDGFSADHGFSHEDLVVDGVGALLSVARRTVPGLREKLDFRLHYIPTNGVFRSISCFPAPHCEDDEGTARTPITDYGGQRYLLALKLSGFEELRQTPLRLVELHAGYFARGFTREEEVRGDPVRRRIFFGVGLNVSELLFPGRSGGGAGKAARSALEYLQLPYTAAHSN